MLGLVLKTAGHEVTASADGMDALKHIESMEEFDLLVTDLRMAPVDGVEVVKATRQERPDLPIIVLSAYLDNEIKDTLMGMGANNCIEKPFSPQDIIDPIRDALL